MMNSEDAYQANVGDAVFWDSATNKFVFVPYDEIVRISTYTPIGIVAIPTSHDVYGTGECGIVSLNYMTRSNPDVGSASGQTIYAGGYDLDLNNIRYTSYISYGSIPTSNNNISLVESAYLPSDLFKAYTTRVSLDKISSYKSNNVYYAPSPYLEGGEKNLAYSQSYIGENCLSNFNGKENSSLECALSTYDKDWKTASTLLDSYTSDIYPASCACWRYHPIGTAQGDWYLPSIGELGYYFNRLSSIISTKNKIAGDYEIPVYNHTSTRLHTSTHSTSRYRKVLDLSTGYVVDVYKFDSYPAVAFLRLKA